MKRWHSGGAMMTFRPAFRTVAIALGVLTGIYASSCGLDNQPEAATPRELRFFQTEPSCPEKKQAYLLMQGEHFRRIGSFQLQVWVCGLEYSR
jgi:hypothetical protein